MFHYEIHRRNRSNSPVDPQEKDEQERNLRELDEEYMYDYKKTA